MSDKSKNKFYCSRYRVLESGQVAFSRYIFRRLSQLRAPLDHKKLRRALQQATRGNKWDESVGRRNDLRTRERAASLQALIPATRAEDEKVFFPRGVGSCLTYSESISPYVDEIIKIFFFEISQSRVKCLPTFIFE